MSPRVIRVLAHLAGGAALAIAFFLFAERGYIGFPDGFIDEWQRDRKVLLAVGGGVSLLAGAGFVALGRIEPRHIGKKLGVAILVYGLFIALTLLVDQHLSQNSGIGG